MLWQRYGSQEAGESYVLQIPPSGPTSLEAGVSKEEEIYSLMLDLSVQVLPVRENQVEGG